MSKLLAVARRAKSRAPMEELSEARIGVSSGVEGDHRGRSAGRQVAVLSREAWSDACRELGRELPWTARRSNLLVEGVELPRASGARLRLGEVVLEVTQETAPCARMDEAAAGLRRALTPDWRGGVTCRVIEGGTLRPGSEVSVEPAPQ